MLIRSMIVVVSVGFATSALAQGTDFCASTEQTRRAGLHDIETNCSAWEAAERNITDEAIDVGSLVLPGGNLSFLYDKHTTSRIDNLIEELRREISNHVEASGLGWSAIIVREDPRLMHLPDATGQEFELLKQYPDVAKAYADFERWLEASISR